MQDRRDRERAVERLLPQALDEASHAGRPGCVDAETLAAWSSGTLRASDAAEVETHLADCAHCQAVLGTFVRTAPPAVVADSIWTRWHLRWLVPLATAATALTVYLLVPGGDLVRAPETTVSMVDARRDQLSAPAQPAERQETPPVPAPSPPGAALEADRLPAGPSRPTPAAPTGPATIGAAAPEARRPAAVPDAPAESRRAREAEDRVAVMAQAAKAATTEARAEPPALMEKAGADSAPARPTVAAPAAAAPAAPPPPAAGTSAETTGGRSADTALNLRRQAFAVVDIATPMPATRYRIVAGLHVERTTTNGRTWEALARPVDSELTAGSAPSADVCWVVGRAGAVWRTTDGARLVRIAFPEPADLVAVRAESAEAVSVTTADGRTFHTTDGGKAWR